MKVFFKQNGQSVVEYVLLLAMVMFLISTIFRSPLIADLFGEDSGFFKALKDRMEFSYRFTHLPTNSDDGCVGADLLPPGEHCSYREGGGSRFAGATEVYTP